MDTPEVVLRGFMKEMNTWEKQCAVRTERCISGAMNFDEAEEVGLLEYMKIFNRYCSIIKGQPRDYYFTEPPDYDPDGEIIEGVTKESSSMIKIQTRQHYGHQKRHIFRLIQENGEWRLFDRQILMDDGEVLESTL
jgi:hypothetical protein